MITRMILTLLCAALLCAPPAPAQRRPTRPPVRPATPTPLKAPRPFFVWVNDSVLATKPIDFAGLGATRAIIQMREQFWLRSGSDEALEAWVKEARALVPPPTPVTISVRCYEDLSNADNNPWRMGDTDWAEQLERARRLSVMLTRHNVTGFAIDAEAYPWSNLWPHTRGNPFPSPFHAWLGPPLLAVDMPRRGTELATALRSSAPNLKFFWCSFTGGSFYELGEWPFLGAAAKVFRPNVSADDGTDPAAVYGIEDFYASIGSVPLTFDAKARSVFPKPYVDKKGVKWPALPVRVRSPSVRFPGLPLSLGVNSPQLTGNMFKVKRPAVQRYWKAFEQGRHPGSLWLYVQPHDVGLNEPSRVKQLRDNAMLMRRDPAAR